MACTFPTLVDITGAEIIVVAAPKTAIGSFTAGAIDKDKSLHGENSIIGIAIRRFNQFFAQISLNINTVSDNDCLLTITALKFYIAGLYAEHDNDLRECDKPDGDTFKYQDVDFFFDQSCELLKLTDEVDFTSIADFCKYSESDIDGVWGATGFSLCNPCPVKVVDEETVITPIVLSDYSADFSNDYGN